MKPSFKTFSKKRALFVCGNLPCPIVSGGRKREFQLLSELSNQFDTELLCITRNIVADKTHARHLCKYVSKVTLLPAVPASDCGLSSAIHIDNLFKRFHTKEVFKWLIKNLAGFNIIHVERGIITPFTLSCNSAPIIISEQNIESEIVREILETENLSSDDKSIIEEYHLSLQQHEDIIWNSASRIITITENDARIIRSRTNEAYKVITKPPKFNNDYKATGTKRISGKKINLIFLGNFNYFPNVSTVNNIFTEIIPLLKESRIDFQFRIVGNGADKIRSMNIDENVIITDFVEDLTEYWEWAHFLIAPISYGGGLKIKVLDSLENRVPVITTNHGVSGFEQYRNEYIFVCENSAAIVTRMMKFINNPESYSVMTRRLQKERLQWNIPEVNYLPPDIIYNNVPN